MRSRRNGFLDDLAKAPWPVGLVVGLLLFVLIRYGISEWITSHGGPLAQAVSRGTSPFGMLAWLALAACWFAALVSFLGARRKRRLLETRTDLDSLATTGWRDFERLVGEAFRRQGYAVEETGLGGADGGIDLILRRDGRRTLVQCKQWRRDRVAVNVVREMYGLLAHHQADKVIIAAWGGFTPDAASFASGKPIELIDGEALLAMIRSVQTNPTGFATMAPHIESASPAPTNEAPMCPKCSAGMVRRTNRRNGKAFWGCSSYPQCNGTR